MKTMEPLSEELQDNQYYVFLLDALIQERDHSLKHRLQKADTYSRFVNEQASILMDDTIIYMREQETSFAVASGIIVEQWKPRMFD